eukprot:343565_1
MNAHARHKRKGDSISLRTKSANCECQRELTKWIKYHKKQYMKGGSFILEWNHFRQYVRTNNQLENRNGRINQTFGSHPYLFAFIRAMAAYYNEHWIKYMQYKNGHLNKRSKKERTKNELLTELWDFIEDSSTQPNEEQLDKDILIFLKYSSIALKGKTDVNS